MFQKIPGRVSDALLRVVGAVLLSGCWRLTRWLFQGFAARDPHHPPVVEVAAAAAGFLCFSSGAALALLGVHLFDRIAISQRWARPAKMKQRAGQGW